MARMTNLSLLLLASALVAASAEEPVCIPLLEAASDCSLWVHSDATLGTGTIAGKVCVGGSLVADGGFSLGTGLASRCEDGEYSLVVGGDLTWPTGVKGARAHCVGGSLLGQVSQWGPLAFPGCSDDSVGNAARCADAIDFESDHSTLTALSDLLSTAPPPLVPSTAENNGGLIQMTIDASQGSRHFVEMDAGLFEGHATYGVGVNIVNGDEDDIEVVVVNLINVPASGFVSRKWFSYSDSFATKVLFNYNGTSSVSTEWSMLKASLLAPRATFAARTAGMVGGQVVVEAYEPAGYSQTISISSALLAAVQEENLVALAKDITIQLDAAGAASISPADVDDGSFGTCGIASKSVYPDTFDCSHVAGPVQVTLTITDYRGNSETATAYITVQDTLKPIVVTQDIVVQLNANGSASITPYDVDDGSSDNCDIDSMSLDQMYFDCSHVGENTVTLTVADVNGNYATATATVTVEDNVAPTVATRNIVVQLDAYGQTSIEAHDVDDGSYDACGIESMSVSPSKFNCSHVGPNTVTLTVTDVNGNYATETATVTVQDSIPPVVLTQDIVVELDVYGMASITPDQVDDGSSDACGIDSMSVYPNQFNCSQVESGPVLVTLTVTDVNGNYATATAYVTVEDNIAPDVIAKNVVVQLDAMGQASIEAHDVDDGSSDACGIESMSVTPDEFSCSNTDSPVHVNLSATDVNGNSASDSAYVTVQDLLPPVLVCQDATVYLDLSGHGSLTTDDLVASVTDNCGVAMYSTNRTQFGLEHEGDNEVTVTAIDVNGRTSECTANVEVLAGCMGLCPGACMHNNAGDNSCTDLIACPGGVCPGTLAENNRNIPCELGGGLCYCTAGSDYCGPSNIGQLALGADGAERSYDAEAKAWESTTASQQDSASSALDFTWVTAVLLGVIVLLSVALVAQLRSARQHATEAAIAERAPSPVDFFMDVHGETADKLSPSQMMPLPELTAKLSFGEDNNQAAARAQNAV